MKLTSKSKVRGSISTARWILQAQIIDFLFTTKRDVAAALRFFRKAIRHHVKPEMITIDKSSANADKPDEEAITVGQSKYLGNLIEQDHWNIKRRSRPMLGVKPSTSPDPVGRY